MEVACCVLHKSRSRHLNWNRHAQWQSLCLTACCLCVSPLVLGWNQDAARGRFNPQPAEGGTAAVLGRHVSFHVFCSYFNCDKELSLGNSLSAWEKGLLGFQLEKGCGRIFVWRPEKENDRSRHAMLPSRRSRALAFIIMTGDTSKWNSYKIWDQHLASGRKWWDHFCKPLVKEEAFIWADF